jgi:hypothetical protein
MSSQTVTPAFSRRHYVAIADALEGAREHYDAGGAVRFGVEVAAEALVAMLGEDNPRFDAARFLAACGVEGDPLDAVLGGGRR